MTSRIVYDSGDYEEIDGAGWHEIFTFVGRKEGETIATVESYSPLDGTYLSRYAVSVDASHAVTVTLIDSVSEGDLDVVEEEP